MYVKHDAIVAKLYKTEWFGMDCNVGHGICGHFDSLNCILLCDIGKSKSDKIDENVFEIDLSIRCSIHFFSCLSISLRNAHGIFYLLSFLISISLSLSIIFWYFSSTILLSAFVDMRQKFQSIILLIFITHLRHYGKKMCAFVTKISVYALLDGNISNNSTEIKILKSEKKEAINGFEYI